MKHLVIIIMLVAFVTTNFEESKAQNCNAVGRVASDLWSKVRDEAIRVGCGANHVITGGFLNYSICFAGANKINNLNNKLISFWNSKANNSWATVGPRRLNMNQNLTGTIVGTTGRTFVSLPVLNANKVSITINETGGKGKTSVTVCKVNAKNQKTNVGTKWFNDNSNKKKKSNEKHTFTVNGAKNQIITIHLDGKSVGNTFKYKVRGILIDFTGAG